MAAKSLRLIVAANFDALFALLLSQSRERAISELGLAFTKSTADAIDDDDFNTIAHQFHKICERRGVRFADITNTTQV